MTDDELQRAYAAFLARPRHAARASCVSPEAILDLVDRHGIEEVRLATLDHVMSCEACRRDLDLLRAAHAAAGHTQRRVLAPGLRIAAMIAFLALAGSATWLLMRREPPTVLRGDAELVLHPPTRVTNGAWRFAWQPVPAATIYDVEVMSVAGEPVFRSPASDTALTLPDSVNFERGRDYLWTVRAERRDGTQVRSIPRRFRAE